MPSRSSEPEACEGDAEEGGGKQEKIFCGDEEAQPQGRDDPRIGQQAGHISLGSRETPTPGRATNVLSSVAPLIWPLLVPDLQESGSLRRHSARNAR